MKNIFLILIVILSLSFLSGCHEGNVGVSYRAGLYRHSHYNLRAYHIERRNVVVVKEKVFVPHRKVIIRHRLISKVPNRGSCGKRGGIIRGGLQRSRRDKNKGHKNKGK